MDMIMDGKRYFLYSSLSKDLKNVYCNKIYLFLWKLVFEYQGFRDWYKKLYIDSCELSSNREIVICEDGFSIVGIAILKSANDEKKICTLRVAKEFRNQGIGRNLMEISFRLLNTDKPMITLHRNKLNQFEKLLDYYGFELTQTHLSYYNIFSTELVFNGTLPQKEVLFKTENYGLNILAKIIIDNNLGLRKNYYSCLHNEFQEGHLFLL